MQQPYSQTDFINYGQKIARDELEAIQKLIPRIDQDFASACQLILNSTGRLIVIGMGKSGHIGRKIAATLASTGTPSFFIHPGEASHGDLGMITHQDIILMISNSGETSELLNIVPFIKKQNLPIIAMTGNPESTLAQESNFNLNISVDREAGVHGLAPTSSSTVTLVMGDALAMTLLEARGFSAEDFAFFHPAGSLGKKLTIKVEDLMHKGSEIPTVSPNVSISDALIEITSKRLGMTLITEKNKVIGIFTDGDLRRSLDKLHNIKNTPINEAMSTHFYHIEKDKLASEALAIMRQHKITTLAVMQNDNLIGVLHMHDLLRSGIN